MKLFVFLCVLLPSIFFSHSDVKAQVKSGIVSCDVDRLLINHPNRTAIEEKLQLKAGELKKLLSKHKADLMEFIDSTDTKKLSETEYQKFYDRVENAKKRVAQLQKEYTAELREMENQLLAPVLTEISDAIRIVAKEKKVSYVVNSRNTYFAYTGGQKDITDDVAVKMGITFK